MTDLVVAKFGGTSVADFDAMNRSIDVALLDANTRIVVLSASAGVTNILVALAGGLEPTERFSQLDALRQIQFNILERLRYPNVIREEIERLLENITTLAEAAALAAAPEKGSIIMLLATDAPLDVLQLGRLARRAGNGLARTGSLFGHGSGDVAIAFSSSQHLPQLAESAVPLLHARLDGPTVSGCRRGDRTSYFQSPVFCGTVCRARWP